MSEGEAVLKAYLKRLSQELASLPDPEREQHVLEIESHIKERISHKISKGSDFDLAVQETLDAFLSPQALAGQILKEHREVKEEEFGGDFGFKIGSGFLFAGLGQTAVSILKGELVIELLVLGLITISLTLIWLFSGRIKWNGERLAYLKQSAKPLILFVIPLGAISFIIRSVLDQQPNFLSFWVLLGYIGLTLLVYFLLKRLYTVRKAEI